MENTQNNRDSKESVLTTIVAGIIVLGALILWMRQTQAPQQVLTSPTPDSEAASISQEIETLNVNNLNAELEAIDKELEGL